VKDITYKSVCCVWVLLNMMNTGVHAAVITSGDVNQTPPGSTTWIIPTPADPDIMANNLVVGQTGTGTLTVPTLNTLYNNSYLFVGFEEAGNGTITVTGSGRLHNGAATTADYGSSQIGYQGTGQLDILSGATVTDNLVYIGALADGSGTVRVNGMSFGNRSTWNVGETLYAGVVGDSALTVSAGGAALIDDSFIAGLYGSSSSTLEVTGNGSTMTVGDSMVLGYIGDATATIANGAQVTVGKDVKVGVSDYAAYELERFYVGSFDDDSLPLLNQTALDALIKQHAGDDVTIEHDPSGNALALTLVVMPEGQVITEALYTALDNDPNITTIRGYPRTESPRLIFDPIPEAIKNTITSSAQFAYLVSHPNDTMSQSSLTVTSGGTLALPTGNLYIGGAESERYGEGTLTVSNGGTVADANAFLATGANGTATVSVTDAGSVWNNNSTLYVGHGGTGTVSLSDGGKVASKDAFLGYAANSVGAVTVSGTNTLFEITDMLVVGQEGSGSLTVNSGGSVTSQNAYIGRYREDLTDPNDPFNAGDILNGTGSVTVTGAGSSWTVTERLSIASALTLQNGGAVTIADANVGINPTAVADVNVTGTGSILTSTNLLTIGDEGYARLTVADGAQVQANDVRIGTISPDTLTISDANLISDFGSGVSGLVVTKNTGLFQADQVDILPNGALRGDGRIVANQLTTQGVIGPGNSIGTLRIQGDVTFEPNSILEIEVDNSGNSDQLRVDGTLQINGGKVKTVTTETVSQSQSYTIATADTIDGTFTLDAADSAFLRVGFGDVNDVAQLEHDTKSITLNVSVAPFDAPTVTTTPNRKIMGDVLQEQMMAGGNKVTTGVQNLQTVAEVESAYDQLMGQSIATLGTITQSATTRYASTVSGRLHGIRQGAAQVSIASGQLAMAGAQTDPLYNQLFYEYDPTTRGLPPLQENRDKPNPDWGYWLKAYGALGDRDGNQGGSGYTYQGHGYSIGFDYRKTDKMLWGFSLGMANTDISYAGVSDSTDIKGLNGGLYASYNTDYWYLDTLLTLSKLDYSNKRNLAFVGESLQSSFNGFNVSGYVEAGWDSHFVRGWLLQPLASVQVSSLSLDDHAESGGDSALSFGSQDSQSIKGSVGARLTRVLRWDHKLRSKLQLRGRWIHDFQDSATNVDAHFTSDPTTVFTVSDKGISADSILLGTGYHLDYGSTDRLLFDYDLRLNTDEMAHVISGYWQHRM
jgi:T5SS/PEP-CTERM-associated repeat protein